MRRTASSLSPCPLGMDESIAEKYSNLDAQLREQFKLYEQAIEKSSEDTATTSSSSGKFSASMLPIETSELIMRPSVTRVTCTSTSDEGDANDDDEEDEFDNDEKYDVDRNQCNDLDQCDKLNQSRRIHLAMNVTVRRPAASGSSQRRPVRQKTSQERERETAEAQNNTRSLVSMNDSGETTNDDNYESADDEQPNQAHKQPSYRYQKSTLASSSGLKKSTMTLAGCGTSNRGSNHGNDNRNGKTTAMDNNSSTTSSTANRLVQTVHADQQRQATKLQHQLQLRCQKPSPSSSSSSTTNNNINSLDIGGAKVTPSRRSNLTSSTTASTSPTNGAQQSKQNNLTRGKQQRASISSCSSSDSYVSYGSGYASGSGNSTDHEHKQQQQQLKRADLSSDKQKSGNELGETSSGQKLVAATIVTPKSQPQLCSRTTGANEKLVGQDCVDGLKTVAVSVAANGEGDGSATSPRCSEGESEEAEEQEESAVRLSKDLNELEQLTDELARANLFSGQKDGSAQTNSDNHPQHQKHLSSTSVTSAGSSKASSVLSTSSNISSLVSDSAKTLSINKNGRQTGEADDDNDDDDDDEEAGRHRRHRCQVNDEQEANQKNEASARRRLQLQQQQQPLGQLKRQTCKSGGANVATPSSPLLSGANQIGANNESRSTSTTPTIASVADNQMDRSHHQAASFNQMKQQQVPEHQPPQPRTVSFAVAPQVTAVATTTSNRRAPSKPLNQYAKCSSGADADAVNQRAATAPAPAAAATTTASPCKQQQQQQDTYYHNLFQWEQLVSKGVTRPLLINDLDFTDLRDEDDCDLLNGGSASNNGASPKTGRNQFSGEPLTISIPPPPPLARSGGGIGSSTTGGGADHDSVDSGTSTGSPSTSDTGVQQQQPASAPAPPMPPPPISPWFGALSGSRPQSQLMSTPSPQPFSDQTMGGELAAGFQSPANSMYSNTGYSRNSVCGAAQNTPLGPFNSLQASKGNLRAASSMSSLLFGNTNGSCGKYGNKRKKTMKLFWKEVREDKSLLAKLTKKKTIWDEIKPVPVNTSKLEYLFESKAKDLSMGKSRNGLDGSNQRKVKITVLDAKRSNAINIGMTKLPPMRTIKNAILKMDSSIMNREGIEKILTTMMPSEEEKSRIIEAQLANPDTPLGTAEQFLLNLASISALEARLKLWAFQLDYAQIEKEVAEPLMDLKQAINEIERSETFRVILGTLLSIGNFLNSTNVKGFQIDYLEKVPEVKDTVHKHSLLHHLCMFIQEKFPHLDSDLYSEFSAVNRASKVDYAEVAKNLKKMQQDCKASWDYLKIVAKHDGLANLMNSCGISSSSSSTSSPASSCDNSPSQQQQQRQLPKTSGKLNNLSKLSMITTVIASDSASDREREQQQQQQTGVKQLKIKVSDFLTDCAERIMVLMVIHRRLMNRFQKLLVYLGCTTHQIRQTQPQQILKIINEFALEYRTKRSRVREILMRAQKCHHHQHPHDGSALRAKRWAGSQQCMTDSANMSSLGFGPNGRPFSTTSSCASPFGGADSIACTECAYESARSTVGQNYRSNHANQNQPHHQQQHLGDTDRCGSPSAMSRVSDNYSDYLFDQSCCDSRRSSVTPVRSDKFMNSAGANRRAHSMSVSMFDLQNQHHHHPNHLASDSSTTSGVAHLDDESIANVSISDSLDQIDEGELTAKQKDEQLRRLLGGDKSLYGACRDLYQMKHWTSTMARVSRPESQAKLATIRRMSGQQLDRRESNESGQHTFPA